MKRNLLITILFLSLITIANAQGNEEKAMELGLAAIKIMDEGQLDESIELLEQAQKLDPKSINYPYEIALANYKKKNYDKAIKILNSIRDHKDVSDHIYQLLGNSFSLSGNPEKALEVYGKGMKKFPNSGKFHLESGQIKFANQEYNEAISFWEQGIKVNPNFSSNYYRLSKIFSFSEERVWVLIYGEYFMLLEPGTHRTEEISELLYKTYQDSYEVITETSGQFHLTEKGFNIDLKDEKFKQGIFPFEGTFAMTFVVSSLDFQNSINLATIYKARKNFLDNWFDGKEFHKTYPNKLLDYQKTIKENNHIETYTYWMLSQGNPTEFQEWLFHNEHKFDEFVDWFNENRISISETDFNSRRDYD